MVNKYYIEKQYIEKVNRSGKHLGYIEKWEAHKKGLLHRGFGIKKKELQRGART